MVLKENSTFGEFKLIKQLGRGGMAEVYLARADGVGGFQRNLALKVIHPQLSHDQEFVQMLIDEAKLSAQLNHPNIVHIHNLGQVQGVYYIAMEFIDGCDVYQALVKSEGRDEVFPVEVAAWIAHEACAGLYYAHTRRGSEGQPLNIIHRDISPQNIQLSREGEVKIVDFGIAKAEQRTSHTQQGVIKGKYSYMSPEQAWGDDIDHRSDIFSLGICLYEMLAGEVLYDAEDGLGLLEQVRLAQIPSLRAIRPEISPEIEQIVYRSLAAEPLQRFNTAEDMRTALAGYLFRSGVTSGRQHLTQFLDGLLGSSLSDDSGETLEDDGVTRALSASVFESLHAVSMLSDYNMMGTDSLMSDDQDQTRALGAGVFSQLQSPQPSEGERETNQDFMNQDPTRAVSAGMFSQFQHLSGPTPQVSSLNMWGNTPQSGFDPEEKTRAIGSAHFNGLNQATGSSQSVTAPVIAHVPSLIQAVPQLGGEEKTRAINPQALQAARSTLRQPPTGHSLPTPPTPPISHLQGPSYAMPMQSLPSVSQSPPPPPNHLASPQSPNHVAPQISPQIPDSPVPFTMYKNEESTRAVDLNIMTANETPASPSHSPYMKQVLRDTFSIPKLPELSDAPPFPSPTSIPSHVANTPSPESNSDHDIPKRDHITGTFPDPNPKGNIAESSPEPLSIPPIPALTHGGSGLEDLPLPEELEARPAKRQRKKKTSSKHPKKVSSKNRRPKGRGRRKSLARFILLAAGVLSLIVGAISIAPQLLAPPIPPEFKLSVSSPNASRARIYLDGQDTGQRAPALLQGLKPDVEYLAKLSAPGYESQERRVQVKGTDLLERSEQSLRIFLKRARGTLKITSTPNGASVTMGDRYLGKTPIKRRNLKRTEGDIRITFTHPKCRSMSLIFSWGNDVNSEVKAPLKCSRKRR